MATTKTRAERLVWSLGARKELLDSVDKTRSLDLNSGRDNLISIHVNKRIFLEKLLAKRIWELYWPISRLWLAGRLTSASPQVEGILAHLTWLLVFMATPILSAGLMIWCQ